MLLHGYLPLTKTRSCWAHMAKLHINFLSKLLKSCSKEALFWDNDVLVLLRSCHSWSFGGKFCRLSREAELWQWSWYDWSWCSTLTGEEFRLRVKGPHVAQKCGRWFLDHLPGRSGAKLVLDHVRHQNFGARCGGNSEIEVAPNFARTRLRRGRNSNLVLYLCANPVAGCMVLFNGARNRWSRAFLGRGNTLDNPISSLPSSSSPKPQQFDFCTYFQRELGTGDLPLQSAEFDFWWKI